ncbi:MAG TPA: 3-oxo-tetronate kinase [Pseudogracilibacillus sp.]|nr:3-oxo-tetronate kinase [Pseudogracilibacillus sp.]
MGNILLGIVADDFSGASDAASFLVKQGVRTLLFNGIPEKDLDADEHDIAVVIALKTRTEETELAVRQSLDAFEWLRRNGAEQLYSKYCSTFDSTNRGNIGPIIDAYMEKYDVTYTIIAPALPVNGRKVIDGHLFVDGVPLHKTHMRHHPLTPMWDSDLAVLLEEQAKYPTLKLNVEQLYEADEKVMEYIEQFAKENERFYVIPDFSRDEDADRIIELFGDLSLLTGGSGLMSALGKKYMKQRIPYEIERSSTDGKGIVLAGSCSKATLEQIEWFKSTGKLAIKLDPLKMMRGEQSKESVWEEIERSEQKEVLVYSSDKPENVKKAQEVGKEKVSALLEESTAYIAKCAEQSNFHRIVVAGGETSGAVTQTLGYDAYIVGESIAPGVPIMIPMQNENIRLILKSGNFGQKDFFTRALDMTRREHHE